jgi:hypothetical protein
VVGAAIFVVAAALRVALLPTARFGGDEALFFGIGADIVDGVRFPLLGTQLTDGAARLPGPACLYLMALPLLFKHSPEAQYLFVELLGAATVLLFWHTMRRPFGERGALFAGVLMALSPWSALYADRTWNPNVSPFFLGVAFFCALRVHASPRSRFLMLFVPSAAVLAQFHMSAPVAWAGLLVLLLPVWRTLDRRHLGLGLLFAALLYVPLMVHEFDTGFGNTRQILAETVGSKKEHHPTSFLWIPVYALRFLTLDVTYHELTGYWGGPDEIACLKAAILGSPARPFHPLRLLALLGSVALAVVAVAVWARSAWTARREGNAGKTPAWFALAFVAALAANLLLLGATGKQVFGHYVTNLFPFVFVAFAALGQRISDMRKPVAVLVLVCGGLFCIGGVESTLSISRRVDGRIGLEVHRRTLEFIRADGQRDGDSDAPVRLDFAFRSSWYDWHMYATRAMNMPIHFDKNGPRRYRLIENNKPLALPADASGPFDVGYARLIRFAAKGR